MRCRAVATGRDSNWSDKPKVGQTGLPSMLWHVCEERTKPQDCDTHHGTAFVGNAARMISAVDPAVQFWHCPQKIRRSMAGTAFDGNATKLISAEDPAM